MERGNRLNRLLDRALGIPLAAFTALLRCGRAVSAAPPGRVGFLCLGAIGDLLLLTALTSALRRRLPHAHFALLTSNANAGAARLVPHMDQCASFGVRQVPSMVAWLRRQKFDVLVDSSQWVRLGAVLCNLSGAGMTIGFDTAGQCRNFGYTRTAQHRNDRHEVENFLALGRTLYDDLQGVPELHLPDLPDGGEPPDAAPADNTFVCLHMWPSGIHARLKEWPAEHWAQLARLLDERGFQVLLTGSGADAARNEAFLRAFPQCRARSLAGRVGLTELARLLGRAAAVVSVNTGTMHLAALCGAPTVGLHGPTNPLRWGPVGPRTCSLMPDRGEYAYLNLGFEYPRIPQPCMEFLPVEDVMDGLGRLGVFRSAES